jgi:hypothetical protein
MQVTIEIEQNTFSLLQKANGQGISLDILLREALNKLDKEKHLQEKLSPDDWIESLKKWANKTRNLPEISNEMFRRENLYEDRI